MSAVTFKSTVYGDSHDEVVARAEEEICAFLEIDPSDMGEFRNKVNYDLLVEQDSSFEAEFTYKAEVIARIRQ